MSRSPSRRGRNKTRSPSPGRGRTRSPSPAQLRRSFRNYDFNGDGEISFDELMSAVKRLPGCQADEASVRAMMAAGDIDSNGNLSEAEFVKVMTDAAAGLGIVHANWAVMSSAAAELTITQTKKTIFSSFDAAEQLGRQSSQDLQKQLSAGEEGGEVGSIPRLAAELLDVLYLAAIGVSVLGVEHAIAAVDFNTFWAAAEALTGQDLKKGVSSKYDIILAPLEDFIDGAGAIVTICCLLLLVGALFHSILYRSQTIGQLLLNHVIVDTSPSKGSRRRVSPMTAVMFSLLSIPTLDPITGLATKATGAQVVFSWSITEHRPPRQPPLAPTALTKESTRGSLASLVHSPWSTRPWSDASFIGLYIIFTAGCIHSTNNYLTAHGVHDIFEEFVKLSLQLHPWFILFGSIPLACATFPGLMIAALAITYGVSALLLCICRELLRPVLYLLLLAFALSSVGGTVVSGLQGVPITMLIGPVFSAVVALRYLYQHRASFELQISIYKEAIVASLVNPQLTFLVPVLEAAFQLYQFQLLVKVLTVQMTPASTIDGMWLRRNLLWALWTHQLWTVFTLRVVFEMICSSVIGRYYYKKSDAGGNALTRTFQAVANAFTKSLGTACYFGLIQFAVMALQALHSRISSEYNKTSWKKLPIKLVLFVMRYLLAWLILCVESLTAQSVTYAGLTGENLCDSARRATDTMATDGVQVFAESAGTGKLTLLLVGLSITLSETVIYLIWEPLTDFFAKDFAQLGSIDNGMLFVVFFCMLYINISIVWVLERASKTIMVCALDECRHDGAKLSHAPLELKAMLRDYMHKKQQFPSMVKNGFVLAVFCGVGYGLGLLQADGSVGSFPATWTLIAAMVAAIVA